MESFTVRETKMINSNFRLLSKDLEQLSIDVNIETNIARFSRSALRRTKALIASYWKMLRNRGVHIEYEMYKSLLKTYLLYRSELLQRARRIEMTSGPRAG